MLEKAVRDGQRFRPCDVSSTVLTVCHPLFTYCRTGFFVFVLVFIIHSCLPSFLSSLIFSLFPYYLSFLLSSFFLSSSLSLSFSPPPPPLLCLSVYLAVRPSVFFISSFFLPVFFLSFFFFLASSTTSGIIFNSIQKSVHR